MKILTISLANETPVRWFWKVEENGRVIAKSEKTFRFYLESLKDARAQGHNEPPTFKGVPADAVR